MFGLPKRQLRVAPFLATTSLLIAAAVPGSAATAAVPALADKVGIDSSSRAQPPSSVPALSRLAAFLNRSVPDPQQGDEFTEVVANSDGTWTSTTATTPIRARDADGDWAPIDLTLSVENGRLVPRNAPVEMSFSNGGDGPFAVADPVTDTSDREVQWSWPTDLPAPEIDGNTATYKDAVDGGDLVVIANPTGFTHNVVLRERPTEPIDFAVTVTTPSAQLKEVSGQEMAIIDGAGEQLASVPQPVMWDSSTDALGDAQVEPVDFTVQTHPTGSSAPDELVLSPADDFLSDPDTVYPVTVDPTFTLLAHSHAWATNEPGASFVGPTDIRAGFDGQYKSRAFLKFNGDATWDGKKVVSSKLYLRNWISGSCKAGAVRAYRVTSAWNADSISWSNIPTATATGATDYSPAHGINDVCPNADAQWDITNIVQSWADNSAPNYGLRVGAADETNPNTFRRYRGMGWSANVPKIVTTYTQYPGAATTPSVSPMTVAFPEDEEEKVDVTTSRTPTVSAKATDPDGDQVRLRIRAYADQDPASTVLAECTTPLGASGSTLTCQLPALPNNSMAVLRAKAVDANGAWAGRSVDAVAGWSGWHPVAVNAPESTPVDPVVLSIMERDPGMSESTIMSMAQDIVDESQATPQPLTQAAALQQILDVYLDPVIDPATADNPADDVGDEDLECLSEAADSPDFCLPATYVVEGDATDTVIDTDLTVAAVAQAIDDGKLQDAEAFVESRGEFATDQVQQDIEELVGNGLPENSESSRKYYPRVVETTTPAAAGGRQRDESFNKVKWVAVRANPYCCQAKVVQEVSVRQTIWLGPVWGPSDGPDYMVLDGTILVHEGVPVYVKRPSCKIRNDQWGRRDPVVDRFNGCSKFVSASAKGYHDERTEQWWYGTRGGTYHHDFEMEINPRGSLPPRKVKVTSGRWKYPTVGGAPSF